MGTTGMAVVPMVSEMGSGAATWTSPLPMMVSQFEGSGGTTGAEAVGVGPVPDTVGVAVSLTTSTGMPGLADRPDNQRRNPKEMIRTAANNSNPILAMKDTSNTQL
ncbi:MAG: hypothetical protein DRN08_05625 [Thermoplasmata archaeon]|nr:MAG: hypothetical protein DRN08_05625 [Thermoplasmata archaeon]